MTVATEGQYHVLAVDDSLIDRKLIERLLKTSSYQVTTVDSGSKALELLGIQDEQTNHPPSTSSHHDQEIEVNLVITDYCMPGMTGYDLLKKIKESSVLKDIPVVIMSSENVPSRINRCLDEGAEEFILKPVQLSDLKRLRPHLLKGKVKDNQRLQNDGEFQHLQQQTQQNYEEFQHLQQQNQQINEQFQHLQQQNQQNHQEQMQLLQQQQILQEVKQLEQQIHQNMQQNQQNLQEKMQLQQQNHLKLEQEQKELLQKQKNLQEQNQLQNQSHKKLEQNQQIFQEQIQLHQKNRLKLEQEQELIQRQKNVQEQNQLQHQNYEEQQQNQQEQDDQSTELCSNISNSKRKGMEEGPLSPERTRSRFSTNSLTVV